MSRAELREAEMTSRTNQKNRVTETVKTISKAGLFSCCAALKRGVHGRNFQKFASGFFEEKSRGEIQKSKPTKEKRKDAEAANRK